MVRLRAVLVVALALGWSMATASPAAAMTEKVTAEIDNSECGVAVVTVTNPTDHEVDYELGFVTPATSFTIGEDNQTHRLRVTGNAKIFFFGGADVKSAELVYERPVGCATQDLQFSFRVGCTNGLISVENNGDAAAPDVRVRANDQVIASGTIEPRGSLVALVEPEPGDSTIELLVEQRAEQSDVFFALFAEDLQLSLCNGREVTVTDTCTGVRIAVKLRPGAIDRLIVERATGPKLREDFEVRNGDTIDVEVPTNTLLAIGFPFQDTLKLDTNFDVARFHRHVANCPASPKPPAGGGGGLPVTGAPTAAAAGVGAGLLLLGGAVLLVVRRRRSTFTA